PRSTGYVNFFVIDIIHSPQRHREHRANTLFARSGDGDRAKELSPAGIVLVQTMLILAPDLYLYPGYSGEAGCFFSLAAFSRPGKNHFLCDLRVSVVQAFGH
ncbi:MAG: hypothetical protein PVF48_14775, partial [Syntrophobacterales bacterium]